MFWVVTRFHECLCHQGGEGDKVKTVTLLPNEGKIPDTSGHCHYSSRKVLEKISTSRSQVKKKYFF